MKLARLYVDLAVDSKPQPDVLVVSPQVEASADAGRVCVEFDL